MERGHHQTLKGWKQLNNWLYEKKHGNLNRGIETCGGRTPKQYIQFSTGPRMVFDFRDFWKVKTLASVRVASLLHSG